MNKIPYHILALQVELLFEKEILEQDADAHCKYIADFINSCGWTETEYFNFWIKEQNKES